MLLEVVEQEETHAKGKPHVNYMARYKLQIFFFSFWKATYCLHLVAILFDICPYSLAIFGSNSFIGSVVDKKTHDILIQHLVIVVLFERLPARR